MTDLVVRNGLVVDGTGAPGRHADVAIENGIIVDASKLSRRLGDVPSDAVGGFCGVTAILGLITHLSIEPTVIPSLTGWLAVLALGLGPVGIAFFVWDYGVKRCSGNFHGLAGSNLSSSENPTKPCR